MKWSTYARELLAIFASIKHFRSQLEGRQFTIFTDHKPITFAFSNPSKNSSPRVIRQLDYIGQFTTDIRYVPGIENAPADALSRIEAVHLRKGINYRELAKHQATDAELQALMNSNNSGLVLKEMEVADSETKIFCDVSTPKVRPYLTPEFRRPAFDSVHNLAHPGAKTTTTLVSRRYVWPGIKRDCARWARACVPCQRAKVSRHTKTPLGEFEQSSRFEHVHIDIVGPLTPSDGKSYVVTMIDRTTGWPEAVPVNGISAVEVADVFLQYWVARFGAPGRLTTDQGRQFESQLFGRLAQLLGTHKIRTTPYHPQANGRIERWHRALKAAIMAYKTDRWTQILPFILLGLRSAINSDCGVSPAQLTYGKELRLPGEFFASDVSEKREIEDAPDFVRRLGEAMRKFADQTRWHGASPVYIPATLKSCSHVFVRVELQRKSLQPPYTGPHKVISRDEKTITVNLEGKTAKMSLDRVKPAFMLRNPELIRIPDASPQAVTIIPKQPRRQPVRQVRFRGRYPR